MDHSREEASGFQRDGHGSHGESPNSEADPNYGTGSKIRCALKLQGGHSRHTEVHANLEARLDGIQGPIEEDGVEYGGSSDNEY